MPQPAIPSGALGEGAAPTLYEMPIPIKWGVDGAPFTNLLKGLWKLAVAFGLGKLKVGEQFWQRRAKRRRLGGALLTSGLGGAGRRSSSGGVTSAKTLEVPALPHTLCPQSHPGEMLESSLQQVRIQGHCLQQLYRDPRGTHQEVGPQAPRLVASAEVALQPPPP